MKAQRKQKQQTANEYTSEVYDGTWRRLSKYIRDTQVFCVMCKTNGIYTKATLTDHIIPVRIDPTRRLDETNLQVLCTACHSVKSFEDYIKWPELYSKAPLKKSTLSDDGSQA
jgi:5-methylcytosine-specific restriction endonuclease McrA